MGFYWSFYRWKRESKDLEIEEEEKEGFLKKLKSQEESEMEPYYPKRFKDKAFKIVKAKKIKARGDNYQKYIQYDSKSTPLKK